MRLPLIGLMTAGLVLSLTAQLTAAPIYNFEVPGWYRFPTPLSFVSEGVQADFTGAGTTPATFSIQTGTALSTLPGLYLQGTLGNSVLEIFFHVPITGIGFTFATADDHDPGGRGSPLRLVAWLNASQVASPPTVTGDVIPGDRYPQGVFSLDTGTQTFNKVVIDLAFVPQGGSLFMIDNVTITPAVAEVPEPHTVALAAIGLALVVGGLRKRRLRRG